MESKKRGRPRIRDTIFLECPICHNTQIKSLEKDKLKGCIKWNPIKKQRPETIKLENIHYKTNNTITELTTCPSGNFHKWTFNANDLICSECNKSYNQINKNNKEFNTNTYFDKLKKYHLMQLAVKYCLDGSLHEISNENNIINNKY